ncbi:hypothetical protein, variant [Aphanomyces astaci]|uniref:sphingomyelin phosphodiesterase n=1 Tax=Aphanomyces astaci TaxID=112090 RepID=W4G280_APHAT|nr:hypothetical protein, variant [Aphanomyces astaci]ETV73038.1 hypothetical protein, variant [Aphanomyces astaci]|eukprot:XP_009837487.1 hypothetical protein, variant [Aphanomyces astaci]
MELPRRVRHPSVISRPAQGMDRPAQPPRLCRAPPPPRVRVRPHVCPRESPCSSCSRRFHTTLGHRRMTLPKESRVEFQVSVEARYAQSAKRMRERLNAYLHRLLELPDIPASAAFRGFLSPRSTDLASSSDMKQTAADLSPSSSASACSTASAHLSDHSSPQDMMLRPPALPPLSSVVQIPSACTSVVLYGSSISLRTCGGLRLGLTKRSAWSGSHKMAAMASGAGMVLLSGPVGLPLAALGTLGTRHWNKAASLSVQPKHLVKHDEFIIESASPFSGAARPVHFNDLIRLYSVSKRQYLKLVESSSSHNRRGYVTSCSQSSTVFRWVSPLHVSDGPIVCGSQVCLQVAHELLTVHKDFITTGPSPAVCQLLVRHHPPCLAAADGAVVPRREPVSVRILTYNVWFLPPLLASLLRLSPFKMERARAIPAYLPVDVDLVVFCEVFDLAAKAVLSAEMKRRGFLYETVSGRRSRLKATDSGVFVMSRYPLDDADELLYGAAATGDDKVADKGAVYVRMTKSGQHIHVVATHLQAWKTDAAVAVRRTQLEMLARWIHAKNLPRRDAVVYGGDFNVDEADKTEYEWMLSTLNVKNPPTVAGTTGFSFDPGTNVLAATGKSSGGHVERLDYVVYGTEYRHPGTSSTQVLRLKATEGWTDPSLYGGQIVYDLSDHYPVLSDFHFD